MPYLVVEDFSAGLDIRKSAVTAKPGSLRSLRNAYVNAGGEVEKRKAFAPRFLASQMGAGYTVGLAGLTTGLVTFGDGPRPSGLDAGMGYQQLVGAGAIARIRDADVFDGKMYAIAEGADSILRHYYDGVLATAAPASGTARTWRSRVWGVSGDTLHYSKLNNPADWTPGPAATDGGSISLDTQDVGTLTLRGLEAYYDQLAVMGRNGVQLWSIDEDPARNQVVQTLGNTGLLGEHALARFGDGDVLFLSDSGVRSLRARDSSNVASIADIGSPVDTLLRDRIAATGLALTTPGVMPDIDAITEPETGQFWLAWGSTIYVLSTVPSTRIVAWSVYDLGTPAGYFVSSGGRVYLRRGDEVLVYGGLNGATYDASEAELVTPMMSAGTPATDKMWTALDLACEGTWTVDVGTDVRNPTHFERVATIEGPSFGMQKIGLQAFGTHLALRLRSTSASRARVGQIVLHYNEGDSG